MIEINPLKIRLWFKRRELVTLIGSAIVFAILFFVLGIFLNKLLAAGIALLVTFFLKFFWADLQVLGIRCPKCQEFIDTRTPWVCGFKENETEHKNVNTDEYPFINECEECHKIPKAYRCHHCDEPLFLSKDRDDRNPARRLGNVKEKIDPKYEKFIKQKEEVYDLGHKYEVTKLKKKIAIEANLPEKPEVQLPEDDINKIVMELEEIVSKKMSVDQAVEILIAKSANKYKDDPLSKKKFDLEVADAARKYRLKKAMEGK